MSKIAHTAKPSVAKARSQSSTKRGKK
jgi:hypothetical protein